MKRYRLPGYPAKLEVELNPNLLRRNIPPGWRTIPEMAGAVALFLTLSTTGSRGADGKTTPPSLAAVAPIFEHGRGRGATGCIIEVPPVFLSEEEALQVVKEELAQAGVDLSERVHPIEGATEPFAEYFSTIESLPKKTMRQREGAKKEPFQVDGADPRRKVAVEFISWNQFNRLCGSSVRVPGGWSVSTVHEYDTKELAQFVAGRVKEEAKEKVYFGTFYDPIAGEGSAESKRLLRLQVQDFVNWLKAQGAI